MYIIGSLATDLAAAPTFDHRLPVMALHCSGATGRQWVHLAEASNGPAPLAMPDLLGTPSRGPWRGEGAFSLAEEAAPVATALSRLGRPTHLVGHSYGGALALHIARRFSWLVASVCVYEPTAFHLLQGGDPQERRLVADIVALTDILQLAVEAGDPVYAARLFTEFWSGEESWDRMTGPQRARATDWIAKAPLDFHALLSEPCTPDELGGLAAPVTLIGGAATHPHVSAILRVLSAALPRARRIDIPGAGHMGPVTHKPQVAEAIADHIARAEAR